MSQRVGLYLDTLGMPTQAHRMADTSTRDLDDKAVLAAIRKGRVTAGTIEKMTGLDIRSVDKALQRLKRAGQIEFKTSPSRRWVVK